MMDFFKKAGVIFYINVAACVLALLGWIMVLVTNGIDGYGLDNAGVSIALGIIAVLLIAGGTLASLKFGSQHYITAIAKLAALVCIMIMVLFVILDRAGIAAAAVTYEKVNPVVQQVFMTAVVSLVFSIIAAIALCVTAFFTTEKKI